MFRAFPVLLALIVALPGEAKSACPVMLVSGAKEQDTISVTFRNVGKVPIRRLEFNCQLANPRAKKTGQARCYEPNARSCLSASIRYPTEFPAARAERCWCRYRASRFLTDASGNRRNEIRAAH